MKRAVDAVREELLALQGTAPASADGLRGFTQGRAACPRMLPCRKAVGWSTTAEEESPERANGVRNYSGLRQRVIRVEGQPSYYGYLPGRDARAVLLRSLSPRSGGPLAYSAPVFSSRGGHPRACQRQKRARVLRGSFPLQNQRPKYMRNDARASFVRHSDRLLSPRISSGRNNAQITGCRSRA